MESDTLHGLSLATPRRREATSRWISMTLTPEEQEALERLYGVALHGSPSAQERRDSLSHLLDGIRDAISPEDQPQFSDAVSSQSDDNDESEYADLVTMDTSVDTVNDDTVERNLAGIVDAVLAQGVGDYIRIANVPPPPFHISYDTDADLDNERNYQFADLLDDLRDDESYLDAPTGVSFTQKPFVTPQDLAEGRDVQGIAWGRDVPGTRLDFRLNRLAVYENYTNTFGTYKSATASTYSGDHMTFKEMETQSKCSLVHFQLRNLLATNNRNEVFYTTNSAVNLYKPLARKFYSVLDVSGQSVVSCYPFKISSLGVTPAYVCVGGFFGEYALKSLDSESQRGHIGTLTDDPMGITNHISPQVSRSGAPIITFSSNDCYLRNLDVDTMKLTKQTQLDWALNCSALSTDHRLNVVVGDDCAALLLDADTGEVLRRIEGHTDYSFACAWSDDGHLFATGSQDMTTRLYDARNTSLPVAIYGANLGAIRSVRFSEGGRYLATAEPADFVHIFDMKEPLKIQTLDFFGEISGISFAGDSFFVGNADNTVGGKQPQPQIILKYQEFWSGRLSSKHLGLRKYCYEIIELITFEAIGVDGLLLWVHYWSSLHGKASPTAFI